MILSEFLHFLVALRSILSQGAVAVQMMVRSDLASSGVAFTLDPDTGNRDVVVITGSYGLGESVVGGKVDPDEVQVFKPLLDKAEDPIIRRRIGRKQTSIVYTDGTSTERTQTIETSETNQKKPCFSDADAKILAKWCVDIENHYSKHHGQSTPMDIEWAKDGITGKLYIVQARPETVRSRLEIGSLTQTFVENKGPVVLEGTAIGSDAAVGKARVIKNVKQISEMQPGEILIADITDPDWVRKRFQNDWLHYMKKLSFPNLLNPCSIVVVGTGDPHGVGGCDESWWSNVPRCHCEP